MQTQTKQACYRWLAEMLLYPDGRDQDRLAELLVEVRRAPEDVSGPLLKLKDHPDVWDHDHYLKTLEMTPLCPPYIGHFLYEEPDNCSTAATGGRNRYMIEVTGIYKHFGLALDGTEMPDFMSVMLEFLALSLDLPQRNDTGMREVLVESYLLPAMTPMLKSFEAKGGGWVHAIEALQALLAHEPPAPRKQLLTPPDTKRRLNVVVPPMNSEVRP